MITHSTGPDTDGVYKKSLGDEDLDEIKRLLEGMHQPDGQVGGVFDNKDDEVKLDKTDPDGQDGLDSGGGRGTKRKCTERNQVQVKQQQQCAILA